MRRHAAASRLWASTTTVAFLGVAVELVEVFKSKSKNKNTSGSKSHALILLVFFSSTLYL